MNFQLFAGAIEGTYNGLPVLLLGLTEEQDGIFLNEEGRVEFHPLDLFQADLRYHRDRQAWVDEWRVVTPDEEVAGEPA